MNFIHLNATYYYYTFLEVFLCLDLTACNESEYFFVRKSQALERTHFANMSLLIKLPVKVISFQVCVIITFPDILFIYLFTYLLIYPR